MPHKVVITRTAERNLEAIGDYIALDNPEKARETIARLRASIESLTQFPGRNRIRKDLGQDRRVLVVENYLVVYRVDGNAVIIQRVSEGSRDMTRLLDDEEGSRD